VIELALFAIDPEWNTIGERGPMQIVNVVHVFGCIKFTRCIFPLGYIFPPTKS
jgi:hypothetical protein